MIRGGVPSTTHLISEYILFNNKFEDCDLKVPIFQYFVPLLLQNEAVLKACSEQPPSKTAAGVGEKTTGVVKE